MVRIPITTAMVSLIRNWLKGSCQNLDDKEMDLEYVSVLVLGYSCDGLTLA
jgi:hypothetical protein